MVFNIEVNNKAIKAKKGDTILETLRKNGISVPTLCNMETVTPTGACRICVVEVDGNGRLLIPKDLTVFANISKDIVLSPSINIIEIWDKELYEQSIDDAALDFADLAEEVMGQDNDDDVS